MPSGRRFWSSTRGEKCVRQTWPLSNLSVSTAVVFVSFWRKHNYLMTQPRGLLRGYVNSETKMHTRGERMRRGDAVKAIKRLHVLVEDTVSVFKDFEIKNGALVLKNRRPKTEGAK